MLTWLAEEQRHGRRAQQACSQHQHGRREAAEGVRSDAYEQGPHKAPSSPHHLHQSKSCTAFRRLLAA